MRSLALPAAIVGVVALAATPPSMLAAAEPPARPLTGVIVRLAAEVRHISASAELPRGRLLITDQKMPAIWSIDAATGAATKLGSAGVGPGQYVQPGGIYPGANRTTLVLDRAQGRVLVFSPDAGFVREYSIAVQGTSGGSDADIDLQRLDSKDLAYFIDRSGGLTDRLSGKASSTATVLRFDAARQNGAPVVTDLRLAEGRSVPAGDGVVLTRRVIGSPGDGWGVASDGRVAAVRADPYRVDWIAVDGRITRGPALTYDSLPMTEADKAAFIASLGPGPISAGRVGEGRSSNPLGATPLFASTKPAFLPSDVMVAPDGRVWVMRTGRLGAATVIYDVFDGSGRRADRIAIPTAERIVGFGAARIYTREPGPSGRVTLRKYGVQ